MQGGIFGSLSDQEAAPSFDKFTIVFPPFDPCVHQVEHSEGQRPHSLGKKNLQEKHRVDVVTMYSAGV
jgi:hypothetical protein